MTTTNLWPILSLAANALMALLLYSLRSTIRVAILELKNELTGMYATKADLEATEKRLDVKIDVVDRMENGFSKVLAQLRRRTPGEVT